MKGFGRSVRALTSSVRNPASWLTEYFAGKPSKTGVRVGADTVLGLASVIYSVNKISGHLAQLPIKVYDDKTDEKEDLTKSPAYRLLNISPNSIMTPYTFKEVIQSHALVQGNGRAYIDRNSIGTPVALIPLAPDSCQTILVDGEKWHLVTKSAGTQEMISQQLASGEFYKVRDRDMLHIMGTSWNGIWGMHLIEMARDVFGLTQSSQDATAVTMANSGRPGILLETPAGMFRNGKDAQEFLDNFNHKHEGVSNTGRAGMLREGMKATTVPVSAADAQFLQQRKFQREEIAMLFGLESIIGDNTGQTYKSISERNTAYIQNCLQRWFSKWENEVKLKLVNPFKPLQVEFDSTPLAKGDPNSLADYSVKMTQTGSMTINETRAMHGLPPVEGGDMLPHEQALQIAEASEPADGEEVDEEGGEEPSDEADDKPKEDKDEVGK